MLFNIKNIVRCMFIGLKIQFLKKWITGGVNALSDQS